jgi:hypothetical protein
MSDDFKKSSEELKKVKLELLEASKEGDLNKIKEILDKYRMMDPSKVIGLRIDEVSVEL